MCPVWPHSVIINLYEIKIYWLSMPFSKRNFSSKNICASLSIFLHLVWGFIASSYIFCINYTVFFNWNSWYFFKLILTVRIISSLILVNFLLKNRLKTIFAWQLICYSENMTYARQAGTTPIFLVIQIENSNSQLITSTTDICTIQHDELLIYFSRIQFPNE